MAGYSQEVIDKYRSALKKNPHSQVFAPLADAYRELGQHDLAEKICKEGLKHHPEFPGGWVVLGKILKDKKNLEEATKALQQATMLSGDNILAHTLLGEIYLERREADLAIKSFKMVLFFNPNHAKVKKILEKIESLTAKDYGDEVFQFKKLSAAEEKTKFIPESTSISIEPKTAAATSVASQRSLLRVISLIDAFIARNEIKKATELLEDAESEFPNEKELAHRAKILKSKNQFSFLSSETKAPAEVSKTLNSAKNTMIRQKKLEVLNNLLQNIESRKNQF